MFIEKKERSQIHLVLSAKGAEGLIATIVMEEVSLSLSLSLSHTHTHTLTHTIQAEAQTCTLVPL
jgi:hypothetical protein